MKKLMLGLVLFPFAALAQDASIPTDQFLLFLIQSLGGLKGASVLAIVGVAVQIIIKFLSSDLCNQIFKGFTGAAKLLTVSGLTIASGVISLIAVSGMSPVAAIFHSTTLAALMVFVNQLIQHFSKK